MVTIAGIWSATTPMPARWLIASCRPVSASGRLLRRPRAVRFVQRTHQADVIAVGISHDRIPRTPEGVERRLPPRVAGGGQVRVTLVDRLPGREREADDDPD